MHSPTLPQALPPYPEATSMLFADCPFCLRPMPLDVEAGTMDCTECRVHLELKDDPALCAPVAEARVLAPAA